MTQLFIAHAPADADCAERLRDDLAAQGYRVWQLAPHVDPQSVSFAPAIESGIRSSAALVLVWSAAAEQDSWVERQTLYAQRLQKPVVTLALDDTQAPITLIDAPGVAGPPGCADAAGRLRPHLPPSDADDVLLALLTHGYIRERKKGIAQAAELLRRGERREELLALLEEVARADLIENVRAAARAELGAGKGAAPEPTRAESRHTFGVRCPNGHVTYFDKRAVCPAGGTVLRATAERAGKELDELYLRCGTCDAEVKARVDCEGYK